MADVPHVKIGCSEYLQLLANQIPLWREVDPSDDDLMNLEEGLRCLADQVKQMEQALRPEP